MFGLDGDNGAVLLIIFGITTAALMFIAAYRWRHGFAQVHWFFFAAMGFGALVVAVFYLDILLGQSSHRTLLRVRVSRLIFGFILLITSLMAIGALITGQINKKRD